VTRVNSAGEAVSTYRLELLRKTVTVPYRGKNLKVVAFSDWRVQEIGALIRFLRAQKKPDLIVYAGDDIRRFRPPGKKLFPRNRGVSAFRHLHRRWERRPCRHKAIDGRAERVPGPFLCTFIGSFRHRGSGRRPSIERSGPKYNLGYLLYPEGVLARQMDRWNAGQFQEKKLIIISHTPPYGALDFAVRFGSRNIGSRPLRQFLDSSPNSVLCVCGHVHRCGGQTERIGKNSRRQRSFPRFRWRERQGSDHPNQGR